jgi:hypothetical protein
LKRLWQIATHLERHLLQRARIGHHRTFVVVAVQFVSR